MELLQTYHLPEIKTLEANMKGWYNMYLSTGFCSRPRQNRLGELITTNQRKLDQKLFLFLIHTEEKSDFESLYQELSKEAFLRVRNVQHLQKEIDWLKSESRKLSEQCRHLGVGRINHTKSIKHLLQCILDKDIVEVS